MKSNNQPNGALKMFITLSVFESSVISGWPRNVSFLRDKDLADVFTGATSGATVDT